MRFLRLDVPATLVILGLSFAPAQAATGDDPGGEGFLSPLFSSLTGSAGEPTDPGTGNNVNPPATQPVDPPPNNDVKPPATLPSEIPPPNLGNIVNPPAAEPTDPPEDNANAPLTTEPALELPKPMEGDPNGPTANDDQYEVEENSGATTLSVASNDDGNITAVQAVTQPSNGELDQTEMTTFQYTPNPDFVGMDSFTYQAKDANQATSNTATVTINVTPEGQGERHGNFDEEGDEGDEDDDGRRHHKHHGDDDDDDDDGDRRCHRHDHDDHHDHHDHHGDHHGDHDGDHDGDNGDNEWDEWKKDWNHDWDHDDHGDEDHFGHHHHVDDDDHDGRCHRDKDDDDGGDLPDTGSPVNLPLLALSGLLVISGVAVVRRTRG